MKTDVNLALLGSGQVGPAATPLWTDPKPHLRVDRQGEPWKTWAQQPRLRRCSPLTLFLAEATQQALANAAEFPRQRIGLVGVFFTGAIQYSVRFYRDAVKNGAKFASPVLFPETVFNSPLSHLVTLFQLGGPSYAVVNDETAWVSAFRVAATWLQTKQCDQVIIAGAEEIDPLSLQAYQAARWYRRNANFLPSEGAGAVLVGPAEVHQTPTRITALSDGHPYANPAQLPQVLQNCLADFSSALPLILPNSQAWFDPLVLSALTSRGLLHRRTEGMGWAFSATSAWQTIQAQTHQGDMLLPIVGSTNQVAALQMNTRLSESSI
jgi:hypothetical protein